MKRLIVSSIFALILFLIVAGAWQGDAAPPKLYYDSQTALNKILSRLDSNVVYRLGSTFVFGGATSGVAATTTVTRYWTVAASNEYLVVHQFRCGSSIASVDYYFEAIATVIDTSGDSTSAYSRAYATASALVSIIANCVDGGVLVAEPTDTLRLKCSNQDNESDQIWYSYIVERVKF